MTPSRQLLMSALLMLPVASARAGVASDWPCAQPLAPSLTAAAYWSAPLPPDSGSWRNDPRIAPVVLAAAPRDVPIADALARVTGFAQSVPQPDRPMVLGEVFQGLVDATNDERDRVITRIKALGARQRELSRIATQLAADYSAAAPDQPATLELAQRRDFATRAFQEAQRTMRYACEVPTSLDIRLGQFARALQDVLGG